MLTKMKLFLLSSIAKEATWDPPTLRRGPARFGSRGSWAKNLYPERITYFCSAAAELGPPNNHSCYQPPTARQPLTHPASAVGACCPCQLACTLIPWSPWGSPLLTHTHTNTRKHAIYIGTLHLHPGLKARQSGSVLPRLEQRLALNKHLINVCHNQCLLQSVKKGNRNWKLLWVAPAKARLEESQNVVVIPKGGAKGC